MRPVRLATWNVNSLKARMPALCPWLEEVEPDVVCLQETKCADDAFPFAELAALGYESAHHGDGRWNGVAVLSRVGLEQVERGFDDDPGDLSAECRLIAATCDGVRVHSVYVPNGRSVDSDHYRYKLAFLRQLRLQMERALAGHDEVVVAGDFNVAPADIDLFDPAFFEGSTHVTEEERALVDELVSLGLVDTLRAAYPQVTGVYSWWDYRGGDFHKGRGMRIDLVLASRPLADRVEFATVDRNARRGQGSKTQPQPSDHAPVVVQFGPRPSGQAHR